MPFLIIKTILFAGLASLILIWRFTSNYSFKMWLSNVKTIRGIVTIFFEILVFLQLFGHISLPLPFSQTLLIRIFGLLLFILGISLAVWAKFTMCSNWGVPAQHDIKNQKDLVTGGPFAFCRNPIYFGLLLTFIGFEITLNSWLILLVIPLYLLILKAVTVEEKLLKKLFGNKYIEYQARIPRFI